MTRSDAGPNQDLCLWLPVVETKYRGIAQGIADIMATFVAGHGRGAFGLHVVARLVRIESAHGRR